MDIALTALNGGTGAVVVIEGVAGIGKSALLRHAASRARKRGHQVLRARGGELERDFAWGVTRQLLEPALADLDPQSRVGLLRGIAAPARHLLDLEAPPEPAEAVVDSFPMLHGLFWLGVRLAERVPLVLVVDDAQWADEQSLRWLVHLGNRIDDIPILLALAVRSDDPDSGRELLDRLRSGPAARHLRPAELSSSATADMIARQFGAQPQPDFTKACHVVTGGNPFFLLELSLSLQAEQVPPEARFAHRAGEITPDSASSSVIARLRRRSSTANRLAVALAVLGPDAEMRNVAHLARLDASEAAAAADELDAARIIDGGPRLRFAHPIVGSAVYHHLPDRQRALVHREAAGILADDEAPAEAIASHLHRSDPAADGWVVDQLSTAATLALQQGAPAAAARHLQRALAEPAGTEVHPDLTRQLGRARALLGDLDALEILDTARATSVNPRQRFAAGQELARTLLNFGRIGEAYDSLESLVDEAPDREQQLRLEADLLAIGQFDLRRAEAVAARMRALPALTGATASERLLLANVAYHRAVRGEPAQEVERQALLALGDGQLLREQTGDSGSYWWAVMVLSAAEDYQGAQRFIDEGFADARARGSLVGFAAASVTRAGFILSGGDVRRAEGEARAALGAAHEANWNLGIPAAIAFLATALIHRGELDEAGQLLEGTGMPGDVPELALFNVLLPVRGMLRAANRDFAGALEDLLETGRRERAAGLARWTPLWRAAAAPLLATVGRHEEGLSLAEEELFIAHRRGAARPIGLALHALGLVKGGDEAIDLLGQASDVLEHSPARLDRARVLADLGTALRRARRPADARAPLEAAIDAASKCGAMALLHRAHGELEAAGARPRRLAFSGVDSLTASEIRIARLAADGLSNREIAESLFVTRKTVEHHLGRTYTKLSIRSREQLAEALAER